MDCLKMWREIESCCSIVTSYLVTYVKGIRILKLVKTPLKERAWKKEIWRNYYICL